MFESRISAGAIEKLPGWDKPSAKTSAWSYDMEGHARKSVEGYCELASNNTRFPVGVWTITTLKRKNWRKKVNCQKFALILYFNVCTLHEFCGQSINWHDLSQDGHKPVTDDWHDEFPTFITQVITANMVTWAMRLNIVD